MMPATASGLTSRLPSSASQPASPALTDAASAGPRAAGPVAAGPASAGPPPLPPFLPPPSRPSPVPEEAPRSPPLARPSALHHAQCPPWPARYAGTLVGRRTTEITKITRCALPRLLPTYLITTHREKS